MKHISEIIQSRDRRSYGDKLRDPRWQRRRLERLGLSDFRCDRCGESERELQVHHRWYLKGYEPWDYRLDHLETLCIDCHKLASAIHRELKERLSTMTVNQQQAMTQLLSGCRSTPVPVSFNCSPDGPDNVFRIPRLQRCYGLAVSSNTTLCFVGDVQMIDRKGQLHVSTRLPLTPCQRTAFEAAWGSCGEDDVVFEVTK